MTFNLPGWGPRTIEAIDRIADSFCPDIPPVCDRVTDACIRLARHLGYDVQPNGNILASSLEAIADYCEGKMSSDVEDSASIEDLLAGDGNIVRAKLSKDMSLSAPISVPAGKSLVLDLGGGEITSQATAIEVDGDVTIKNGTVNSRSKTVIVRAGGSVTVEDANIVSTQDCALCASGEGAKIIVNSGTVTAQEVPVLVETGADAVINGGTLTGIDNFAVGGNGTAGRGNVSITINGGELIGKIQSAGYIAAGVYMPNSGTFTMNGGRIVSSGVGICMRAGEVNLNCGEIIAYGKTGIKGKVGDSRVVVGPYAVVYDQSAKYPAADTLALNIANGMVLTGTDGDVDILLADGATANIIDNRA